MDTYIIISMNTAIIIMAVIAVMVIAFVIRIEQLAERVFKLENLVDELLPKNAVIVDDDKFDEFLEKMFNSDY